MASSLRILGRNAASTLGRRALHSSSSTKAVTKFTMPAMSPTMTEGGLASWKFKEGDKFSAGDVLLEIETDKATMDVEAQDDGIMAKIVVGDGAKAVPVGKTIAMLAEEGDDISNVEVPAEEEKPSSSSQESQSSEKSASQSSSSSSSSSTSKSEKSPSQATTAAPPKDSESGTSAVHVPHTSKPLMPSVMRLLSDFNVSNKDAESIKGTGVRGMLTKGDVLVYLGKAKTPTGTFKADNFGVSALGGPPSSSPKGDGQTKRSEPLTASDVRSMILSGLASSSHASRSKQMSAAVSSPITLRHSAFDELLDDYQFKSATPKPSPSSSSKDPFQGLL